jgi:predicted enzyme related to lactoylglutathione lyase
MNLRSLRIITEDINRLVGFYEKVTGLTAKWHTEDFAEIGTASCMLAIGSTKTLALFGDKIAEPAANKSVIIEFLVDDVDKSYELVKDTTEDILQQPVTMPWGNRSILFRDPDGNLINFFAPVTPEAMKRFGTSND